MRVSAKEIAHLKEIEARGAKVDWAALDREFNFTISGYVSAGVDISPFDRIGKLVNQRVDRRKFRCELSGIVFFPIILDTDLVWSRPDFITHKRSSKGYFVGRNIDFALWKKSRTSTRISLAADNLRSSVLAIPEKHLSIGNKDLLVIMISEAETKLKARGGSSK